MLTKLLYTLRNISKNSTNSLITLIGLSVAVACCLIIYCFVNQEYSYNGFHDNVDRIFRINYELKSIDGITKDVLVNPEIADGLKETFPQIEKSTEYRTGFEQGLKYKNEYFDVKMSLSDKDFFDMFSFGLIAGNKKELFTSPNEIVITREIADKLLKEDKSNYMKLIGQAIEFPLAYENKQFNITGILENISRNSSIQFDGIIPGDNGRSFGWCGNGFGYTSVFYQINKDVNVSATESNIETYVADYYKKMIENGIRNNTILSTDNAFRPFMLSLNEVYLRNDINNCNELSSSKKSSIILIAIGILILIIACSNYTILSMGQYLKKIGDVGIRKTMGAGRGNIFTLFFTEGALLTLASFILGILLMILIIPVFNRLAQTEIFIELINIPQIALFIIVSFFIIVIITSIIPVLVFSKVNPNQMAGNKITVGKKSFISQVFVSFQYSLSIILIIVTIFIARQSNYLKDKDLGLSSESIINISIFRLDDDQKLVFRDLLKKYPGVNNLTLTCRDFLGGSMDSYVNKGNGEQITVTRFSVDDKYLPTLGLQLIHGKNFTESNLKPGDRTIIVNEKFIKEFEIEKDPIGRIYRIGGVNFSIIGVVKDYHFFNAKSTIEPAMLHARTDFGNSLEYILLKFHSEQVSGIINHINKCYKEVAPDKTLTYNFWDEQLGRRYAEEERWSKIIGYAAIIAIVISSLGLFGLTILHINQRIKEIGVRKVTGAKVIEVLIAVSKSFIIWLFGSLIIAIPVAYHIVEKWLSNFPFKVDISWWVFIISGLIAIVVAILTVSWKSWKAASRNPVEALRYE